MIKFLSKLPRYTRRAPTLATPAPAPIAQETAPSTALEGYVDDTTLRALASTYETRESHWVFAGAMTEMFKAIDTANERLQQESPETPAVRLEFLAVLDESLKGLMAAGKHHSSDNVLDSIGPQSVSNLKITCGETDVYAHYVYNVVDDWFDLGPSLEKQPHRYMTGLDLSDGLAEVFYRCAKYGAASALAEPVPSLPNTAKSGQPNHPTPPA